MQGRARAPSTVPVGRQGVAGSGGKLCGGGRGLTAPGNREKSCGCLAVVACDTAECRGPTLRHGARSHTNGQTRALSGHNLATATRVAYFSARIGVVATPPKSMSTWPPVRNWRFRIEGAEVHVDLAPRAELAVPHRGRRSPCRPGPWTRTLRVDAPLPAPGTRRAPTLESIQPTAAAGSCGARPRPGSAPDLHPFARRDPHPFGRPVRSGAEEGAAHGSSQD